MLERLSDLWSTITEFFMDYIVFPLANINVISLLDIIVLASLLYIVYKFIRDRHASRILIGFVSLVGLYILSDVLDMVAINTILQTFYTVGIIAFCIIFQPEFREMLEEFGATTSVNIKRIANRQTVGEDAILHAVEEISAAAFELSSKGEGALIVIERRGRLRNQMTEGTPVDAIVTRQLLCNIFVNRSPLHDGAVIIRDARIVAASCKSKTISENTDIAEGLGTRHRAALRISEISDAVVVVVSEETGNISIANNKLLNRDYHDIGKGGKHKSNDLRDDLYKLMTGKNVEYESSLEQKITEVKKKNSTKGGDRTK
ncbi:MAG: diadenylate cyclase [Ruminococcaceae bacterium]|nr:diadenylate cyclase [Oscillospiraceae bacterium]